MIMTASASDADFVISYFAKQAGIVLVSWWKETSGAYPHAYGLEMSYGHNLERRLSQGIGQTIMEGTRFYIFLRKENVGVRCVRSADRSVFGLVLGLGYGLVVVFVYAMRCKNPANHSLYSHFLSWIRPTSHSWL